MRLFVAVVPPPSALDDLAAAVAPLRETAGPEVRWQTPDRWHVTLAFLGEVPDERVGRLRAALGAVAAAARVGPGGLELAVHGGGRFGHRVLWAGLTGDVAPLGALARAVARAARELRIDVERRPFRGHLTLARVRGETDLRPLAAALAGYEGPAWHATELVLVRSYLGPHPRHEVLDRWPLAAA